MNENFEMQPIEPEPSESHRIESQPAAESRANARPAFDMAAAMEQLGGDIDLMDALVRHYLNDAPPLFEKLRASLAAGDAERLSFAAHRVSGMARNFCAAAAAQAALNLEEKARHNDLAPAGPLLAKLERELVLLTAALNNFTAARCAEQRPAV